MLPRRVAAAADAGPAHSGVSGSPQAGARSRRPARRSDCGEAIFDLPPRGAATGAAVEASVSAAPADDPRFRRYLSKFGILRPSRVLYQHTVRYHNPRNLELYALLRPGEDSIHILEQHGRSDLMRYRRDVFDDKYARLRADRPCKTIVAHLAKDGNGYIHPTQVRLLSLHEDARVRSFQTESCVAALLLAFHNKAP